MDDALTIESFAEGLSTASAEQSPSGDSGAAQDLPTGEQSLGDAQAQEGEAEAKPEGDVEQSEQPEGDSERANEPVHKWTTANGENYEVSESELRDGYLRQQDYTRKSQAAAEQFRQSQAQIQQQAQQQFQALSQLHDGLMALGGVDAQIRALVAQNLPSADLQVQKMRMEQQLQGIVGRLAHQTAQAAQEQERAAVSAAEQHLASKFRGITSKDVTDAFEHLQKLGPTEQEIALIRTNPRIAEMAILAGKWLDLQAKRPEVHNKVSKLPPPAVKARPSAPTSKTDAAMKAINTRRTFSVAEFAALRNAMG